MNSQIGILLLDLKGNKIFSDLEKPLTEKLMKHYFPMAPGEFELEFAGRMNRVECSAQGDFVIYKLYPPSLLVSDHKLYEMFLAAFEQSYDGVIITDDQSRVVYLNQNYCRFLNVNREDSMGKHVTQVIPNSRMHLVAQNRKAEMGMVWKIKETTLVVSRIPLFGPDERLIGTIGLILFRKTLEMKELIHKIMDMEKKLEYFQESFVPVYQPRYDFEDIAGNSAVMKETIEKAKKIASTSSNVVLTGESGTGKELFAHAIHKLSYRKDGPFIRVNCSAIPRELFESELFGYAEGAFTGAKKGGKAGKFELAHNGTIFLDEIADLPLEMQVKLLRVIQEREVERVGDNRPILVDVRIIAATNKSLSDMVERELFRKDLYYRLSVFHLQIPALRERKEDIAFLAQTFLKKLSAEQGYDDLRIQPGALEILKNYSWPGNVRELRNIMEMAAGMCEGREVTPEILPDYLSETSANPLELAEFSGEELNYKETILELERKMILEALKRTEGQKKNAAKLLGIARSLLYKKMHELGIQEEQSFS